MCSLLAGHIFCIQQPNDYALYALWYRPLQRTARRILRVVSTGYDNRNCDKHEFVRLRVSQWSNFGVRYMCSLLTRHICRIRRHQNPAVPALWRRLVSRRWRPVLFVVSKRHVNTKCDEFDYVRLHVSKWQGLVLHRMCLCVGIRDNARVA